MFTKELGLVSWENNYGKWPRVHEGYMKLADSVKLPSPDPGANQGQGGGELYINTQAQYRNKLFSTMGGRDSQNLQVTNQRLNTPSSAFKIYSAKNFMIPHTFSYTKLSKL